MSTKLRVAVPSDAEAIHGVYAYYIQNTEITFNEYEKSVEAHRAFIENTLETYPYLIAEAEGRMLGFACAEPVRPQSGYHYCVELTIYLCPDTPKNDGVGTLLLSALLRVLTLQGFAVAYSVISGTNRRSIAFHTHMGFEHLAVFPKCGFKHGQWLDTIWMQKILNDYDDNPQAVEPFAALRARLGDEALLIDQ